MKSWWRGFSNEEDPLDLLERAEKSIFDISQDKIQGGFVQLQDLLTESYENIESLYLRKELTTGIPTGFHQLDNLTSGLRAAELTIVAARPGLGKTSFVLNVAQNAAMEKEKVVGIFSLEMGAQQLVTRMLCSEARVDSHKVRSGYLSKEDWKRLAKTMSKLARAPVFIDDTPGISVIEMRSKAPPLEGGTRIGLADRRLSTAHVGDLSQQPSAFRKPAAGDFHHQSIPKGSGQGTRHSPDRLLSAKPCSGAKKGRFTVLNSPTCANQDRSNRMRTWSSSSTEKTYIRMMRILRMKGSSNSLSGSNATNGPTGVVKLAFIAQWTKFENLASEME